MTLRSEFGFWAESYVAQYLETKGYKIIDRNYKKPWGEIDIVASKDCIIVFVEVKANKEKMVGFEPEERVSPEKLRRLHRAVQTYLVSKKHNSEQEWQIDIVALTIDKGRGVAKIKHFKNVDI